MLNILYIWCGENLKDNKTVRTFNYITKLGRWIYFIHSVHGNQSSFTQSKSSVNVQYMLKYVLIFYATASIN